MESDEIWAGWADSENCKVAEGSGPESDGG